MSLATRCPACQTVFRVVQDQLRVSEGWVRCGRCNEVFNAVDQMVDLGRPAAAAVAPPPPPLPPPVTHGGSVALDFDAPPAQPLPSHVEIAGPDIEAAQPEAGEPGLGEPTPVAADDSQHAPNWDDLVPGALDPERAAEATGAPRAEPMVHEAHDDEVAGIPGDAQQQADEEAAVVPSVDAAAEPPPTFVQAADRAARWQRPAVRRSLYLLILLAAVTLLAQAALEYRDLVAARWPATRPALEALCRLGGCRIEPPRWIEALAVDSSGLVRIEGTTTYRFTMSLRNRSSMALALPSIDLTLTDAQGRVIARRAFLASELGGPASTVAAGAEQPLQATLSLAERAVAGYTIEIFYP